MTAALCRLPSVPGTELPPERYDQAFKYSFESIKVDQSQLTVFLLECTSVYVSNETVLKLHFELIDLNYL